VYSTLNFGLFQRSREVYATFEFSQGKQSLSGSRIRIWFWVILAIALVLRCGAAIAVQRVVEQTPGRICLIAGDAEGYWELGRKLARGQNFEIYEPPRRVLRMPGFPAVLAASIAIFGEDVGRARFVLALIGTLACGCVYWLSNDLFGPEVGLIATALAAISPTFVVFSVMILSETAFALTLMLSLISLAYVVRGLVASESRRRLFVTSLIAGLATALACYMRPSWLLFPPAAAGGLWMWRIVRPQSTSGGSLGTRFSRAGLSEIWVTLALLLGLALGLLPWTVRNYYVTDGKFVPTTLWMGPSLYDGLNPLANGDSHMEFLPNSEYEQRSEYEVDRHYRREAWKWAADHPQKTLLLAWIKLGRYWNLFPNTPQFDSWFVRAALLGFVIPVVGVAIWGLVSGSKWCLQHAKAAEFSWMAALVLTAGPIIYFSALHTLFVSSLRYRLPAEYPLLALSAVGVWDLWQRYAVAKAN
jgi:hypothetical protein